MIRIGICDDDPTICSALEKIILTYQAQTAEKLEIEAFCIGEELMDRLSVQPPLDLIFLDIELGAVSGVEIGHLIRRGMEDYVTKIVYISSKSCYDRQLLEVQPLHFLEKPLQPEKVFQDITLALRMMGKENSLFSFKTGHEDYRIPVKEIIYFESIKREVKLVGTKNEFQFYDKLDRIAGVLSGLRFMRPHQSYLINYDHAVSIKRDLIVMSSGDQIPVSRLKSKEIKRIQLKFEEEK